MRLQGIERFVRPRSAVLVRIGALRLAAAPLHDPSGGDGRLDLVLLEEEPLPHTRPLEPVVGEVLAAFREEEKDGARLGDEGPIVQLEDGHSPGWISPAMLWFERLAGEDVDEDALVRLVQVREEESRLEAVPRSRVVVQSQHAVSQTVLVDARNVLRSRWPNIAEDELVRLVQEWAAAQDVEPEIVFDGSAPAGGIGTGRESADDWITRRAGELEGAYGLVTSDRELRERAGERAERVIGGGAFASLLLGDR